MKMIHVINIDRRDDIYRKNKTTYKIGNSDANDLLIYDNSIDTLHATIE
jgi:hypothetical protein